jgi:hypothetical protein
VLLDGWGYQDTHETLNSFIWGPDGWLYGCQGVFTHSEVGRPGTPADQRVKINAGIWRYHPTKKTFEVFAEGTSNPWGIDFDANGQLFAEACVIPHMWHIIPGARYQRQAGQHFNPHTYDDIKQHADHVHWAGTGGPHAGNGRSDAAGGGHAHAGLMIYQATTGPSSTAGRSSSATSTASASTWTCPRPRLRVRRPPRRGLPQLQRPLVAGHQLPRRPRRRRLLHRLVRRAAVPQQRPQRPRPLERPHLQGLLRRREAGED